MFLLVLATNPGHLYSVDGLAYYRTATALAWDGSLVLDPRVWGPVTFPPVWPVGFSLALFPPALVLSPLRELQPIFAPDIQSDLPLLYGDPVYALLSWVNGLIVGLCAAITMLVAKEVGLSWRLALAAGLASVLASPLFFYARADFAQPLTTALLLAGILVALRTRRVPESRAYLLLLPIAAWSILTRPVDGLLSTVVWIAVIAWPDRGSSSTRQRRTAMGLAIIGTVVGFAATSIVNVVRRGDPLDFGYGYVINVPIDPFATTLAYLISPGRGIPWHIPLLLLAPIGVLALVRAARRAETVALLLPLLLWMTTYAFWISLGDVSYGPRLLLPVFPLIAVLAAAALTVRRRFLRPAFIALAVGGTAANVALLAADQLRYWATRGENHVATPGFWRQFEPGAFAPLGSLRAYQPTDLSNVADIVWLRLAAESGGLSIVLMGILACVGLLLLATAVTAVRGQPVFGRAASARK